MQLKERGIEISRKNRATIFTILRLAALLLVVFAFMLSLELLSSSFRLLGSDTVQIIISATSNPFISLFIGLLTTAIVQSSSLVTSMIVAVVASGTLSLEGAIPMVMGANIGTTVTSTIVSLAHIVNKKEFRKAFAVATLHDFFNILVTIILFPLEYYFGLLSSLSLMVTQLVLGIGVKPGVLINWTVKPIAEQLSGYFERYPLLLLVIAVVILFGSINYLSVLLRYLLIGNSQKMMEKSVFGTPIKALLWGIGITGAIHSSSVTTSLVVPLVATDKLSVKKAFPFIMGANIGTTITALLASISKSEAAISIAFVHLLFNLIGVLIFFPIPAVRYIPVFLARKLGNLTVHNRLVGLAYLSCTFFLIPFLLIYLSEPKNHQPATRIQKIKEVTTPKM